MKHNDFGTAREMIAWTRNHQGHSEMWANMFARLSEVSGLDPTQQFEMVLHADSENIGVRKVLALHLMNTGRKQQSVEHLFFLQERNVSEGAYFLGVLSEEDGQLDKARSWFERAYMLNPAHMQTADKLESLRVHSH